MKVAFIGLGNMGEPMAQNILKAGHDLTVFNRTVSKADRLKDAGAKVADSPRDAAQGAEVICTCVSTPDDVRRVVLGKDGVLEGTGGDAVVEALLQVAVEQAVDQAGGEAVAGPEAVDDLHLVRPGPQHLAVAVRDRPAGRGGIAVGYHTRKVQPRRGTDAGRAGGTVRGAGGDDRV